MQRAVAGMMASSASATELPPEVLAIDYLRRWYDMVERRRVQMESARARAGILNDDYWGKRAKAYRRATHERTAEDPFLLRLLEHVTAESAVLDVGAGTGRHTLALAPHVRRVTAVDPSPAMLGLLKQDAASRGIGNVAAIEAEWMRADVEPADFVICSHVLYPIAEVVPFVRKLEASALSRVFIYIRADPLMTDLGLWSEFYGVPLQQQPTHVDLINVLAQIGVFADVEIVTHRFTLTYESMEEAVDQVGHGLCLHENDAQSRAKLRALLDQRLAAWPGGRVGPEAGSPRSAILSWTVR